MQIIIGSQYKPKTPTLLIYETLRFNPNVLKVAFTTKPKCEVLLAYRVKFKTMYITVSLLVSRTGLDFVTSSLIRAGLKNALGAMIYQDNVLPREKISSDTDCYLNIFP